MRPIFCGNLEYDTRQSEVESLFKRFGNVERVDMKTGFAFVYMDDERDAEVAIRKLDQIDFGRKGRRLRVEWTKQERESRRPGSGGGRKPAANARPSRTLFVINFDPMRTKERDLERHFDPYGKISNIRIRRNFGFIQFETQADATRALESTNLNKLGDRVITVEYAIRDDDDADRGNGYNPDNRGRAMSPNRGFDRRRLPSPYRRERGSPDYGYARERSSPDYGHGPNNSSEAEARRSPNYGRDGSPANGRYDSRSTPPKKRSRSTSFRDRSPPPPRDKSRSPPRRERSPSSPRREMPMSPPRKKRFVSPPRGERYVSPPPRDSSLSPQRDRSVSPPRRDISLSPPRRARGDSPPPWEMSVTPS